MKNSSIVSGSHFVNKNQCVAKLSQLSKMEELIGIVNDPSQETTPRQFAQFNLCCFLVVVAAITWFLFPFEIGKKEVFIFLACLFVTGLLIREIVVAPDSYLDSLFSKLEEYKPMDMEKYRQHSIENQIQSKQLNISETRCWIEKEKKTITSYMDKNCFFYDDDED